MTSSAVSSDLEVLNTASTIVMGEQAILMGLSKETWATKCVFGEYILPHYLQEEKGDYVTPLLQYA